jgi:hypothetical protein
VDDLDRVVVIGVADTVRDQVVVRARADIREEVRVIPQGPKEGG